MRTPLKQYAASKLLRGFTAAELSAVAAIIAILAVIIVPIFRDRVDEARRVGTLDDMQGLAKALVLANADTLQYPRLNDLDNGINLNDPPLDTTTEVPIGVTLRSTVFSTAERASFGNLWNGPYAAIQRSNTTTFTQIQAFQGPLLSTNEGPIRFYTGGAVADDPDDLYPLDHYGSPYIYFPPGTYIIDQAAPQGNETNFAGGVIYSLGPNGLPGDGSGGGNGAADPTVNQNRREAGILGTGDDLQYVF